MPNKLIFRTPEKFTQQYLKVFIQDVEPLFRLHGHKVQGVLFDTGKTKEINIL